MSPNQRQRGNRGNASNGGHGKQHGGQGGHNGGSNGGSTKKAKPVEVKDFWGESVAPLPPIEPPTGATDPSAMVRSLGKPPLAGNDNAPEHYFAVVYERAAVLAGALSAALLE